MAISVATVGYTIIFSGEDYGLWERAAKRDGVSVAVWLCRKLDDLSRDLEEAELARGRNKVKG